MPIPSIPLVFDVRKLVKAGIDKRGRSVGDFEDIEAAKKESRHRVRLLGMDEQDDEAMVLAETLLSCKKGSRCGSLACPRCARVRRIHQAAPALEFLPRYDLDDLQFLTLINPADAVPAGQLHTFDPRKFINRTRRQLERAEIDKSKCFLIGGIDGEWDEGWKVFQPHLHAITFNVTNADLKRVIKRWPSDPERVRLRKRLEPIDDLPRITAYLDKTFWPAVARKNNPREIHPHAKRRPPEQIEIEILKWLHSHNSADLRLMYGIKLYHRKLVKT